MQMLFASINLIKQVHWMHLHDVRKQYKRNHSYGLQKMKNFRLLEPSQSQFNDAGINELFEKSIDTVEKKTNVHFGEYSYIMQTLKDTTQIADHSAKRVRYLK